MAEHDHCTRVGRRRPDRVGLTGHRVIMAAVAGALHLGTSGFAYDAWMNGVFYPKGLRLDGRLAYYASVFNAGEINYTFRRLPSDELFALWRAAPPHGVTF